MREKRLGWIFLLFSLLAFAGLGLEMLLAFLIEPLIYGYGIDSFTKPEMIIHWSITIVMWIITALLLVWYARRKLDFDLFDNKKMSPLLNWTLMILILIISIVISLIDWKGLKVVKEYNYHGFINFVFQYLYYIAETILVFLMIVFAQKSGEEFFSNEWIPYGGIFTALTWGLIHAFTKGNLIVGLISFLMAILMGVVYLLGNKNSYKTFPIILLILIL